MTEQNDQATEKPLDQETLFGVLRRARARKLTRDEACAAVTEIYVMMTDVFTSFLSAAAGYQANSIREEREHCALLAEKLGAAEVAKAIREREE